MWKFVPKGYKYRWIYYDGIRILKSLSNKSKLRKLIGELKARNRYEKWHDKFYQEYLHSPNQKPRQQVFKELKYLAEFWGVFPYQYFIYHMFEKETPIGFNEMDDYTPEHFMYYWYYIFINGKNHDQLTNKKYLSREFEKSSIDAPQTLLYFEDGRFLNEKLEDISDSEAYDLLNNEADYIAKPYSGSGGKNIFFIQKNKVERSEFKGLFKQNAIVQEKIENAEEIKAFHPNSLNTFRIIVRQEKTEPKILFAFLRFGIGNATLDNVHMGGLFVGVDIDTGQLFDVAYNNKLKKHNSHPDTQKPFGGVKIESWEEIKHFVVKSTQKFDQLKIYGWDIAYTKDGPKAIEINSLPDIHLIHTVFGGLRKKFGIDQEMIRKVGI